MKKLKLLFLFTFVSALALGQSKQPGNVGINTDTPTETLDVNGTMRIQKVGSSSRTNDVVIVDEAGVLYRVSVEDLKRKLWPHSEPANCGKPNCEPNDLRGADIAKAKAGDKICWGELQYKVISFRNRLWLDRNLGATQPDDETKAYGDKYQWGRFGEGHQCKSENNKDDLYEGPVPTSDPDPKKPWYGKVITVAREEKDWLQKSDSALWNTPDYKNNPCPLGWHVPTIDEWKNAIDNQEKAWEKAWNEGFRIAKNPIRNTIIPYWSPDNFTDVADIFFIMSWNDQGDKSTQPDTDEHYKIDRYHVRCIKSQ